MSIPTPPPMLGIYPDNVRPVSQITPFTYRDGLSYLKILETLIDYVNSKLVADMNVTVADIVDQMNTTLEALTELVAENETEYNRLLDKFMAEVETRIMTINNKSGNLGIRRYQVTDDLNVDVSPDWPDEHRLILQFTQDFLGHPVTFDCNNLVPSPIPDGAADLWESTSSQWWPGKVDVNGGRRNGTLSFVTTRDETGATTEVSRIRNIGGVNIPISKPGFAHTFSVYTRVLGVDAYTVTFNIQPRNSAGAAMTVIESAALPADPDNDGWSRAIFTTVLPAGVADVSVTATVNSGSNTRGGEQVHWTDAQIEASAAPTTWRGSIINPLNLSISQAQYTTTEIDLTPQPNGLWVLNSIMAIYNDILDRINAFVDLVNATITEFNEHLNETIENVYTELDRRSGDVINVTSYEGVDPTGKIECSSPLQNAINDARGKRVVFPEGTYLINTVLEVKEGTYVEGHNAIIRRADSATGTMFANYDRTQGAKGGYDSNSGITISGMIFDGGPMRDVAGNLVTMSHARDITVRDCRFMRCTGYHHLELNAIENGTVDNCIFEAFFPTQEKGLRKEAIQIDCANVGSIGFGLTDGTPSRYITVNNCHFRAHKEYGGPIAVAVGSHATPDSIGYYDHISVTNCRGLGLLYAGAMFVAARRLNVQGNNFSIVARDNSAMPSWAANITYNRWVIKAENSTNSTIIGNVATGQFTGAETNGNDTCIGVNGDSNRCRIIGNNVIDGYALIYVGDGGLNVVADNTLNGACNSGIRIYKANLTNVHNNQISGNTGAANYGVWVNGVAGEAEAFGNLITGNIIQGSYFNSAINIGAGVTTLFINNNLFRAGVITGSGSSGSGVKIENNY